MIYEALHSSVTAIFSQPKYNKSHVKNVFIGTVQLQMNTIIIDYSVNFMNSQS